MVLSKRANKQMNMMVRSGNPLFVPVFFCFETEMILCIRALRDSTLFFFNKKLCLSLSKFNKIHLDGVALLSPEDVTFKTNQKSYTINILNAAVGVNTRCAIVSLRKREENDKNGYSHWTAVNCAVGVRKDTQHNNGEKNFLSPF